MIVDDTGNSGIELVLGMGAVLLVALAWSGWGTYVGALLATAALGGLVAVLAVSAVAGSRVASDFVGVPTMAYLCAVTAGAGLVVGLPSVAWDLVAHRRLSGAWLARAVAFGPLLGAGVAVEPMLFA